MSDLLSKLDQGQFKAVTSDSKHILCLAGAGSGKTRVLTSRVFNLVRNNNVLPENILAITFTKNAAKEMQERLDKVGINANLMWCKTFHATAFKILRENVKFASKIKIITDKDQEKLLKFVIEKLCLNKSFALKYFDYLKENNWPEYLFFEQIVKVIKECKSRSIGLRELATRVQNSDEDTKEFYRLLYLIFSYYQKYLSKNNYYDFEDLMSKAIWLLANDKNVLNYYQNKFKHILVDEFQDINFSQAKFLDLLNCEKNSIFVVGDDWQAIYGWRGGNINYILDFKNKYKQTCESIVLPYNYRSDGNIVNSASKIIKKNKRQFRKKIKPFLPSKNKIIIYKAKDKKDELNFVLSEVKKITANIKSGEIHESHLREIKYEVSAGETPGSRLRGIKPENIMILGRNWKTLAPYADKFKRKTLGFFRRKPSVSLSHVSSDPLITTVHSAKGMEREIVFMVGLHSGRHGFPYIKDDYEIMKVIRDANLKERLCEERRCFYVGITRAKKILYLITLKDRESIFVDEIPGKYLYEIPNSKSQTKSK